MRKTIVILCLSLLSPLTINAQTEAKDAAVDSISLEDKVPTAASLSYDNNADRLYIPTLTSQGKMLPIWGFHPTWGGWNTWNVHEGLNVSLGASVFSTFGSGGTWSGAGFTQSIALLYAMPLTNKLSLSVGGYFGNMSWAHSSWHDAGLTGVLGYQFDNHWSAYLYGQKSFVKEQPMPAHLLDMSDLGDRIGMAVRYTFNPNFAIQMSFDVVDMPVCSPVPMPVMRTRTAQQGNFRP